MKALVIIASLALLAVTVSAELNDMYLHHHPSQAKKLAMAARAANNNQQPQQGGGGNEYHVGGYDFRKSYDNGNGRLVNYIDDYEEPRQRRPYRGSYYDDGGRYRQRRPFRSSYDDYRPRRADYLNGYDQHGPVIGGRYGNRMAASQQNTGVSYNSNGGIDWNNPTLKGSVFVDRGYENNGDFD